MLYWFSCWRNCIILAKLMFAFLGSPRTVFHHRQSQLLTLSTYVLTWTGVDLLRTWEGHSCIKTLIAAVSEHHARWMYLRSQDLHAVLQHLNVTWDAVSQINASFRSALLLCIYAFRNNTNKSFSGILKFFWYLMQKNLVFKVENIKKWYKLSCVQNRFSVN